MKVTVNGEPLELSEPANVAELVARSAESTKGVAVAVNTELVPKSTWAEHWLTDGYRIELLKAAQGG